MILWSCCLTCIAFIAKPTTRKKPKILKLIDQEYILLNGREIKPVYTSLSAYLPVKTTALLMCQAGQIVLGVQFGVTAPG